jgi:hypothetical protein
MARSEGKFSVGNHNEQILYLRGAERDADLMVAAFFKSGVGKAIAEVLNNHLDEVIHTIMTYTGSVRPGIPVKPDNSEARKTTINAGVTTVLSQLNSSDAAAVSLMTGLSNTELDDLGGLPSDSIYDDRASD